MKFKTVAYIIPAFAVLAACQASETAAPSDTAAVAASDDGARGEIFKATFNEDGSLNQPKNWREWVYVGTPLTPNELNGGEAAFPEFHNVYIDPASFRHYEKTGEFPQGTQIVKELALVRGDAEGSPQNKDTGASSEVSGQGFFQGEFAGLEMSIKDAERFPDEPGNWAYFSWGHQAEPYEPTATAFPAAACNACHDASADDDFVFTQFYPVLRAAKGSKKNDQALLSE